MCGGRDAVLMSLYNIEESEDGTEFIVVDSISDEQDVMATFKRRKLAEDYIHFLLLLSLPKDEVVSELQMFTDKVANMSAAQFVGHQGEDNWFSIL